MDGTKNLRFQLSDLLEFLSLLTLTLFIPHLTSLVSLYLSIYPPSDFFLAFSVLFLLTATYSFYPFHCGHDSLCIWIFLCNIFWAYSPPLHCYWTHCQYSLTLTPNNILAPVFILQIKLEWTQRILVSWF